MTTEGFTILFESATGEPPWGVTIETSGFEPVDDIARHLRALMQAVYDAATNGEDPRTGPPEDAPRERAYVAALAQYVYADGTTNAARFLRHVGCWREGRTPQACRVRLGALARGPECFGREEFVGQVADRLPASNVALLAPRRFGKTSILFRLFDAPPPGFSPVLVDLESANTPAEFLATLAVRCLRDGELRRRLTGFEPVRAAEQRAEGASDPGERERQMRGELIRAFEPDWPALGRNLLDALRGTPRLLLLIDELSELLRALRNDPPVLKRFLDWFRSERERQTEDGFRSVLASSTGARHLLDTAGQPDALRDLQSMTVPPLSPENASVLLEELLHGAGLAPSPEVVKRALELLGEPVPYFVQVMAQELALAAEGGRPLTPQVAEEVCENQVLGVEGKAYFRDFSLRLRGYAEHSPNLERGARAVLAALAQADRVPVGLLRERFLAAGGLDAPDFETAMAYLEEDYYIEGTDGEYGFRSKLLRDFWRRHGEGGR